ncbi:LpxL/LpxP family acyltransferase [Chitinilyticum litopenaei]|uniref:LpxL/LpxP family acyltransferase n=1 Tax=Chitinilyticum litopenaei TaxID=1121276 RepID=UPI0003FBDC64|nr:hypothetical protein [Chitinilyticum litopenaei]
MSWARQKERGGRLAYSGMKLLLAVYALGGRRAFLVCLTPVLAWFFAFGRVQRQASLDYLHRLAASAPQLKLVPGYRLAWRHYLAFAETLLDKLHVWSGRAVPLAGSEGRDAMLARLAAGEGGIMLTAHLGNTEAMQAFAHDIPALRLTILVHTRHAASFNRLLGEQGGAARIRLLQVDELDAGLAADLAQRVADGEWLVIAADRVPAGFERRARTLDVDFLGARARLPQGPHLLALLMNCPLVLALCTREPGGFRLFFEPLSEPRRIARHERDAWMSASAQRFADRLALHCQRAPLQWFNFYPFWASCDD